MNISYFQYMIKNKAKQFSSAHRYARGLHDLDILWRQVKIISCELTLLAGFLLSVSSATSFKKERLRRSAFAPRRPEFALAANVRFPPLNTDALGK